MKKWLDKDSSKTKVKTVLSISVKAASVMLAAGLFFNTAFVYAADEKAVDSTVEVSTEAEEISEDVSFANTTLLSIAQLRKKFPANKYWNHLPDKPNNPDGWTDTPCTHHVGECDYFGKCPCNSCLNSIQCMGFAAKLGLDASGSSFRTWTKTMDTNLIKPGDIIRYHNDGHSIYITNVSGQTVTYADCNSDNQCVIKWDKTTTKEEIAKTLTAIYRAPSWKKLENNQWSYYNVITGKYAANEWLYISGGWYHFDGNGIMQTGWLKDNGKWYYLDDTGVMAHDCWVDEFYYMNSSGEWDDTVLNPKKWENSPDGWKYLNCNKQYLANCWAKIDGKWYHFNENGIMQTGWLKDNDVWYLLKDDGAMVTGWAQHAGSWYYMDDNGAMQTGWINDNGTWYYLTGSGDMVADTWFVYKGAWYYVKHNGAMAADEWVEDTYYVDESGALVEE